MRIQAAVPPLGWLKGYNPVTFSDDLAAGLIVAVMLIPQGIAFGVLAGLPPIMGLYSAVVPPLLYALFGTSRNLMVGPAAIIALLTFEAVSGRASAGSAEYVNLVVVLMLGVGVVSLLLGMLRGGFIVRFISHSVVSGFTSAAAIIIAIGQLDNLLGVSTEIEHQSLVTKNNAVLEVIEIGRESVHANPTTALLGLGTVAVLVLYREALRRLPRRALLFAAKFPYPLLIIATSIVIVYAFGLEEHGVAIIGDIPSGLPSPAIPDLDGEIIVALTPAAMTIALIGFIESDSLSRTIATREKEKVDSNQELRALGIANIAGAFFSGFPATGSFARTAVAYQSGGKTQMTGVVSVGFIILALLFLTPLFYYLPIAVLAGIIIVAVSGLVNVREFAHVYRLKPVDGWTMLLTLLATLILGVELGILIGVVFSLAVLIGRNAYPRTNEVGYVPDEQVFRDLSYYPDAQTFPATLIVRVDAPLYFANMTGLEEWLERAIRDRPQVRTVIFDFTTVTDVDAVVVDTFRDLIRSYRAAGIQLLIGGMRGPVKDIFNRSEWSRRHASALYFPTVEEALLSRNIDVGAAVQPAGG